MIVVLIFQLSYHFLSKDKSHNQKGKLELIYSAGRKIPKKLQDGTASITNGEKSQPVIHEVEECIPATWLLSIKVCSEWDLLLFP